jgi:nitrite reductase (NO-forming)/hydroxylamine reductase
MRRLSIALVLALAACAARAQTPDGAALFQQQCAVCHQPQGQGLAGQFPPLAHNPDIFLSEDFPLRVVLFGLGGKLIVNGQAIDSVMPPLANALTDAQIAAVVNYVRGAWGNDALRPKSLEPVMPAMVAGLRQRQHLPSVLSYRQSLKAQNGPVP